MLFVLSLSHIQSNLEAAVMIASSFSALTRAAARQAPRATSSSVVAPAAALSATAGASRMRMRYYSEQASKSEAAEGEKPAASTTNGTAADEDANAAIKKMQEDFDKTEKELARMKVSW